MTISIETHVDALVVVVVDFSIIVNCDEIAQLNSFFKIKIRQLTVLVVVRHSS